MSSEPTAVRSPRARRWDGRAVGGGVVGRQGRSVLLVEKGELGGSAVNAGFIWTAPSYDVLRSQIPDGDAQLAERLVEDFEPAVEVGEVARRRMPAGGPGAPLRARPPDLAPQLPARMRADRSRRSPLRDRSRRHRQPAARRGRRGARCRAGADPQGRRGPCARTRRSWPPVDSRPIPSCARRSSTRTPATFPLRGNWYSTGDGLRFGQEAGGAFGPDDAGFYGHLMPSERPRRRARRLRGALALLQRALAAAQPRRPAIRRRDRRRPPEHVGSSAAGGPRADRLGLPRARRVDPASLRRGRSAGRHVRPLLQARCALRRRGGSRRARPHAAGVGLRR